MDELRSEIWDYLYRARGPQTLDTIARVFARDLRTIHQVVDHEWFDATGDTVAIAYRRRPDPQWPTGPTAAVHEMN